MTENYVNVRTLHNESGASQDGPYSKDNAIYHIELQIAGLLAHGPVDVVIKPRGMIDGPDHLRAEYEQAVTAARKDCEKLELKLEKAQRKAEQCMLAMGRALDVNRHDFSVAETYYAYVWQAFGRLVERNRAAEALFGPDA